MDEEQYRALKAHVAAIEITLNALIANVLSNPEVTTMQRQLFVAAIRNDAESPRHPTNLSDEAAEEYADVAVQTGELLMKRVARLKFVFPDVR